MGSEMCIRDSTKHTGENLAVYTRDVFARYQENLVIPFLFCCVFQTILNLLINKRLEKFSFLRQMVLQTITRWRRIWEYHLLFTVFVIDCNWCMRMSDKKLYVIMFVSMLLFYFWFVCRCDLKSFSG